MTSIKEEVVLRDIISVKQSHQNNHQSKQQQSAALPAMAARQILKVSARAFVSPVAGGSSGGNPVTIFSPSSPSTKLTPELRSRLAQTCTWESVVVEPCQDEDDSSSVSQFSFFMPSGEEVSFCARKKILISCVFSFCALLSS